MISLRRSVREHELAESEQLFEKALSCYLGAIDTIEKTAVEISPGEIRDYSGQLAKLRQAVLANHSQDALEQSLRDLEEQVRAYNTKVAKFYQTSKVEVEQIIDLLREATGTLGSRNNEYDREFRNFATKLEQTAQCDDLRQIRLQLSDQVIELRQSIDAMRHSNTAALKPLEAEMKSIEDRLVQAERLASTDPLTDLYNRREGERRINEKVARNKPFCLLVIDLNRFKWINDRYGHYCGDQVLKTFAKKLGEQVRKDDIVCRWGGDEFLVVIDCPLGEAMQRSRIMAQQLKGRYPVIVNGRKMDVDVSASVGVAQCVSGEPIETAFERADAMLYQMKQQP